MSEQYNPLDKKNLGISVANAMLDRDVERLSELSAFPGAGIYAIYYTGNFSAYETLAKANKSTSHEFSAPIYVGKAVPAGARKGKVNSRATGSSLFKRLNEHASSIKDAENLDIGDFYCRYLVVDDIWIPLGESLLISKYSPVWNQVVDGFGNHTPGKGRFNQLCSRWDVLHPGREWAAKCRERPEAQSQIINDVRNHLGEMAQYYSRAESHIEMNVD